MFSIFSPILSNITLRDLTPSPIRYAAAKRIPPPLVEQLKAGGRLVIPVGGRWATQNLLLVEKDESGKVAERRLLPVAFVPLTRRR